MNVKTRAALLRRRIQILLIGFIIGLVLSGITAFPLEQELNLLASLLGASHHSVPTQYSGLLYWIVTVRNGLRATYAAYPFLATAPTGWRLRIW